MQITVYCVGCQDDTPPEVSNVGWKSHKQRGKRLVRVKGRLSNKQVKQVTALNLSWFVRLQALIIFVCLRYVAVVAVVYV
jgi:hypothetical protein